MKYLHRKSGCFGSGVRGRLSAMLLSFLLLIVLTAGLLGGCGQAGAAAGGEVSGPAVSARESQLASGGSLTAAEEISSSSTAETAEEAGAGVSVAEDGEYTSRDEVAAYLHAFGHLPPNYITKREAEALGWDPRAGNLWEVAPGKSIGGSRFGNYEGSLPEADGRKYFECDIDYDGGSRNAKRIVYSSDGLIFYTEDHYRTFERLY